MKKQMSRKERAKLLKTYYNAIQAVEKQQDKIFKKACKELGIKNNTRQSNLLFDLLYNGLWHKTNWNQAGKIVFVEEEECQSEKSSEV